MTDKERYQSLKERGICVYCKTALAEDGKTTCRICRDKQRKQTVEKRETLKILGFCTECGNNRIFGTETICPECAAKKYVYNRKHFNSEYDKKYQHIRKEHLKAIGICIKCGKMEAEKGKTRCVVCNIKERERARKYRGGIPRSERSAYGLCYFCGIEIQKGNICEKCKERVVNNLPREPEQNRYWKMLEYSRIEREKNRRKE